MTHSRIVIVGGGIAGHAVVEALRRHSRAVAVTLVCGEARLPYDRARLPELLAPGGDTGELTLRPAQWYADRDVSLRLGLRVAALQPAARQLRLDDGESLTYAHAVLCTGSDAPLPRLAGEPLLGIHAFRDPGDCAAIRAAVAAGVWRAVVVGGGEIGRDAARELAGRGCDVTVVDPLERLACVYGSGDRVEGVELTGGERIEAQLVVVAGGAHPQTALAQSAGLAVERGIVVDDRMRTSAAGVLAVGECAQHDGVVHRRVAPILTQAEVAAEELLGLAAVLAAAPLATALV